MTNRIKNAFSFLFKTKLHDEIIVKENQHDIESMGKIRKKKQKIVHLIQAMQKAFK